MNYQLEILLQEIEEALDNMHYMEEGFDELFAAAEALRNRLRNKDE